MSHIYKVSEWQSPAGPWYVNDISDLAGGSGKWWIPARILDVSLVDYIKLLQEEYHTTIHFYNAEKDFLSFNWKSHNDAHRYLLFINKVARNKQFMV